MLRLCVCVCVCVCEGEVGDQVSALYKIPPAAIYLLNVSYIPCKQRKEKWYPLYHVVITLNY